MLFAASTDFATPPFTIPNFTGRTAELNPFVDAVEVEGLKELLGLQFYNLMIEGIAALPATWNSTTAYLVGAEKVYGNKIYIALEDNTNVIPSSDASKWEEQPENIWLNLKVGIEYIKYDKTKEWIGMSSISIPLVVSKYLRYFSTSTTSSGVSKKKVENAKEADPAYVYTDVYNKFVAATCNLLDYLIYTDDDFDAVVAPLGYIDMEEYLDENACWPKRVNVFGI
jgi:hypothetical protein